MAAEIADGGWRVFLADGGQRRLEADLKAFLPRQRWFAGKARPIGSVLVADATRGSDFGAAVRLLIAEVRYEVGDPETYFLPVGLVDEAGAPAADQIIGGVGSGLLIVDALVDPGVGAALLDLIGAGRSVRTARGVIRGEATGGFEPARGPRAMALPARLARFEQSNSSVLFGDRLLLKVFRRLEPGVNPDYEIGKFFAEQTEFRRVPTTAGSLAYQAEGREPMMVGILQALVPNEGTGWDHALAELASFYGHATAETCQRAAAQRVPESVGAQVAAGPTTEVRALIGPYLDAAALLGQRTAEMHLALASRQVDPSFRPEPLQPDDLARLSSEIRHQARRNRELLGQVLAGLPADTQADAQRFLDGLDAQTRQVDALGHEPIATQQIRVHGDYHLGQVLRSEGDFILLDFEGEPAKSLPERLRRASALKDVAGMVRSFDYAAFAALFAFTKDQPDDFARLAPLAQFWRSWVASAYLRAYLATAGDAGFIPADSASLVRLLEAQLLDKALYELLYELNNRPDWVRIPLQGILALRPAETSASPSSTPTTAESPAMPGPRAVSGLTDFDVYLLAEGTHYRSYDKLGAHVGVRDGQTGVQFAVWAPNASRVTVIGEFNGWNPDSHPLNRRGPGYWEAFVPGVAVGATYKYSVTSSDGNRRIAKADPVAFATEVRPQTASVVADLDAYTWNDAAWLQHRAGTNALGAPTSVYEVHLGSWMRTLDNQWLSYGELAQKLGDYVHEMGYTHVELMPIAEHPFDGSWGYQVTGYFAPSSRFGQPQDFMAFVDALHQRGIGVIVDWVPAHFPTDEFALGFFDGTHLYEHEDPRQGFHQDWNTFIFHFGRPEVANFLISNALFWLDKYHIDGLRVDAVASMLYRDYSRKPGEWVPNEHGGRENFEAITLLRRVNEQVHATYPGVLTIAEESTAFPNVSRPTSVGGLGFDLKWDLGWMHDTLHYFEHDPIHRRFHHNMLTFRGLYAFTENFLLPLSHDEVVYGKGSLLRKMPGDDWQKFANLRLLFGWQFAQPGKKLMFMGDEFGQDREWNHDLSLDWHLLDDPRRQGLKRWVRDLNTAYRGLPPLHERDTHPDGFRWVNADDADQSVTSFLRKGHSSGATILFVANYTPVPRHNYRVGVPEAGHWAEILNSDAPIYGGSGMGNIGGVATVPTPSHGMNQSVVLTVPPLAIVALRSPGR